MALNLRHSTSIHEDEEGVELAELHPDESVHATTKTKTSETSPAPTLPSNVEPTPLPWSIMFPVLFLLAAESFNGVSLFSYLAYVLPLLRHFSNNIRKKSLFIFL